ncbi:MAG TPA: hypothetical protein VNO22_14090 [Planctomycetota bacterium]|nr:hypothetical protein [Planctomycetota bacterium]
MRRGVLILSFLLGALPLAADVVVLKDGGRVAGRVADKGTHYEVATDAGLRTFLKEEVEKIVKDPRELLGNADELYEAAKKDFEAAMALSSVAEQQPRIREAIAKVTQARELYAGVVDLFPENDALGKKLMLIMQLMRLCRDRLGSEIARRPETPAPAPRPDPAPPGTPPLEEAFGVLLNPAQRADDAKRLAAREAFRVQRARHPEIYELATAAMLFLSRSDREWDLQGASLEKLQLYFSQPWMRDPLKLTPALHQNAVAFLAEQIAALRKSGASSAAEALSLFGAGHLGHAPRTPDTDRAAQILGLVVRNGIPGTPEGHVVRDLQGWIAAGDFDLAVLAWLKEHRAVDTPLVRYVWAYAMLRMIHQKKRGFERPAEAFQSIRAPEAAVREHLAALVKSIRAAANCSVCGGEGRLRCTNCHGKKEIKFVCKACKGSGRMINKVGFQLDNCPPCKSTGVERLVRCEKCRDGYIDCRQCEAPKPPPEMEEICTELPCTACEGRGWIFRNVLWACRSCLGLGRRLVPKADPSRVLP